ncbi:MAG TPA: DUF2142 domain-containing protein [Halothiobacillus sp.]|nr:DUF2142 domain-containing protein [Halothiobacillus sp.]
MLFTAGRDVSSLTRLETFKDVGTLHMSRLNNLLTWLSSKRRLISIFLLCASPLGIFMVVATPLGSSPDEPSHMARAEGLIRGVILAERKPITDPETGKPKMLTGFLVDAGMFGVSFPKTEWIDNRPVVTQQDYEAVRNEPIRHDLVFALIPNTATYFPAAYVPAAFGLAVGVATNATPFQCMILARLGMLLAFLALGALAIWIAAYGEALIITVLLMPMTLNLAGSMNQDGVLIATTCLCAAALTACRDGRPWTRTVALTAMFVLLSAKPAYVPLLPVVVLPLARAGFWRRVAQMMAVAIPVLIWLALIAAFVIVPFGTAPYHPGPLYTGDRNTVFTTWDAAANVHVLLAQPDRFITLPLRTLQAWHTSFENQMVGMLGAPGLWLSASYYHLWETALLIPALGLVFAPRPAALPGQKMLVDNLFTWLLIILSFWLIFIVAYVDWTDVGAAEVWGVQGRYFLVLLPFLLFAVPGWQTRYQLPAIAPAIPAIGLGLFDLGYLPSKLIAFYYLH